MKKYCVPCDPKRFALGAVIQVLCFVHPPAGLLSELFRVRHVSSWSLRAGCIDVCRVQAKVREGTGAAVDEVGVGQPFGTRGDGGLTMPRTYPRHLEPAETLP